MKNRLREFRKAKGLTLVELASLVNSSNQQISFLETGARPLTYEWASRLAPHLGQSAMSIMGEDEDTPRLVPILGTVGAGAVVMPVDDHPLFPLDMPDWSTTNIETVQAPPGAGKCYAVKVEGDSMMPIYEPGTILFYEKHSLPEEVINRRVIAKLVSGEAYVKKLQRSAMAGRWNLASANGSVMEDVELEWCAKITYTKEV